jgi:hypothetical protein
VGRKREGGKAHAQGRGNENKERRKKPRWVRKDKSKDRSDGGQMGGRTQGQFFVDVQETLRKLR